MNLYLIIIFLGLGFVFSMFELFSKKANWIVFCILSAIIVIAIATRDSVVVPDTNVYLHLYKNIQNGLVSNEGFEIFYVILNYICVFLNFEVEGFFGGIVIINLLILIFGITKLEKTAKNENYNFFPCCFLVCYFSYFGLFYNAIAIRAGLAFSVAFLAIVYRIKKNYKMWYVLFGISIAFHLSMLILFVIIFISERINIKSRATYTKTILFIIFIWLSRISYFLSYILHWTIAVILKRSIIFERYSGYFGKPVGFGFFSQKNILFLLIGVVAVIVMYKYRDLPEFWEYFLKIYLIGLILTFLLNELYIGYRISEIMTFYSFLLLYWIINKKNRMTKITKFSVYVLVVILSSVAAINIIGIA